MRDFNPFEDGLNAKSSAERLLDSLSKNLPAVLNRLSARSRRLSVYALLQSELARIDVAKDDAYQSRFRGYYTLRFRPAAWNDAYFKLLQHEKANQELSFEHALNRLLSETECVEASFASKLLATVRPEMPVYDRHVRENLFLRAPGSHIPARERVEIFFRVYAALTETVAWAIRAKEFEALQKGFDDRLPAYCDFTNVKKLDLLAWQHRPSNV